MYEPPIEIMVKDKILADIGEKTDNAIMLEITQQFGVNVDKHELVRALAFDRGQYNKGFDDGVKEGIQKTLRTLSMCGPVYICDACKHVAKKGIEDPCNRCRYITHSDRSQYYWDPVEVENNA